MILWIEDDTIHCFRVVKGNQVCGMNLKRCDYNVSHKDVFVILKLFLKQQAP